MDTSFCLGALKDALWKGRPKIFNTDLGAQFTSAAFTDRLAAASVQIRMDGRGRWLDNVFVERLWRKRSVSTGPLNHRCSRRRGVAEYEPGQAAVQMGLAGLPVPGQQFGDAFGRVVGGPREDVGEIGLRVE